MPVSLQKPWALLSLLSLLLPLPLPTSQLPPPLPQVFDDKKMFAEWFGDAIASTQGGGGEGADWLEMEKRVVVIHRLHQILEPFMLRRQVGWRVVVLDDYKSCSHSCCRSSPRAAGGGHGEQAAPQCGQ